MPTARTKANRKYNEKAYDRLEVTVKRGDKAEIKAYAESLDLSLNAYINRLIDNDMSK